MRKPTSEELRMVVYFWQERRDLTRFVSWEELEPVLRVSHPHLLDAIERLRSAEKTVDAIVDSIGNEIEP